MRQLVHLSPAVILSFCLLTEFSFVLAQTDESDRVRLQSEPIYDLQNRPTPSCHASTLLQVSDRLLVAWFGGTAEGRADVGIWLATKVGDTWSRPTLVANGQADDGSPRPCWNPVLHQWPSGRVSLFYKVGPSPGTWWGMVVDSTDSGQTWSPPRRLPDGIFGPIKNKAINLPDGRMVSGSSTEDKGWRVHIEWTDDEGQSWNRTAPLNDPSAIGAIQPSILIHPDGRLQAVGRTRQRRVFSTQSNDSGETWSAMQLLDVPNPNSGIDAVTLSDGRHLLVYNPVDRGRSPLSLAVSTNGQKWMRFLDLEDEPGAEFSYPAIIQASDGRIHVTYTWKRQTIHHVEIDPTRIPMGGE